MFPHGEALASAILQRRIHTSLGSFSRLFRKQRLGFLFDDRTFNNLNSPRDVHSAFPSVSIGVRQIATKETRRDNLIVGGSRGYTSRRLETNKFTFDR